MPDMQRQGREEGNRDLQIVALAQTGRRVFVRASLGSRLFVSLWMILRHATGAMLRFKQSAVVAKRYEPPALLARRACKQDGVTLIELMVVIVMVAIVLAVGIPEYQDFTTSNTVVAEVHALKGDMALARSEAATMGGNVIICSSANPTSTAPTCSGTNEWNSGWVVLAPTNNLCSATAGQPLKVQIPLRSKDTVIFSATGGAAAPTAFCFNRGGLPSSPGAPGLFVFNTPNNNASDRLCLGLNAAGHMQILAAGQGGCP